MCFFRRRRPKKDDRLGNFMWELENRPQPEILPSDVVKFSDPLRAVFTHATRMGQIKFSDVSGKLNLPPDQAQKVIDFIVERGFLHPPSLVGDEPVYILRFGVRTRHREDVIPKNILEKLDDL